MSAGILGRTLHLELPTVSAREISLTAAFQIGAWRVDPALDQISRDGTALKLEPRTMEVLVYLAHRPGEVVSVDELLDSVWKDVVVTQASVYRAVAGLRRALGDDPKEPTYIANVMRRGYRLIAPVVSCSDSPALAGGDGAPRASGSADILPPSASAPIPRRRRWPLAAMVVALALGLALPAVYRHVVNPSPRKLMLVVLPFENFSADPSQDYFASGLTEELITQLGSLDPAHLGVIARTSSLHYQGTRMTIAQIAQELGVGYILEGSVRRSADKLRVTAQLIATTDQTHLWAESYDRDPSDILRVQADVARAVADKIRLTLSEQTDIRLKSAPGLSPLAHDAYLHGLAAFNLRTSEGFRQAIAEFDRATALEPNYALAYAELARTYSLATVVGMGPPADMMGRARDAAVHALQIDESVAAAHTTLAFIHAHFEFDWTSAEREYRRAIALNSSDANAHFFYSNSLLSPLGRHEEAIAEMETARQLDPLSAPIDSFPGRTYLWARRYDDALAHLQKSIQRFPGFGLNHVRLAHLYTYMGRFDAAITEDTRARVLYGQDVREALAQEDAMRTALLSQGPPGYWEKVLELAQRGFKTPEGYNNSYGLAILETRLGHYEQALAALEQAYAERQLAMTELAVEPAFDPLHSEPRFLALLQRMGLKR